MNVYLLEFKGHYLAAQMLIVDETKLNAFNKAKKAMEEEGLLEKNNNLTHEDLYLIDTTSAYTYVIDNGDY